MITKDSDMNDIFYIADRYSSYIAEWKKDKTEFSRWYLLAIILEDRAVITRLLSSINSYQKYKNSKDINHLLSAAEKAEQDFNKNVGTDKNRIREAIAEFSISDSLKKLEKFHILYELMVGNGLEADEEIQEGLKEKARAFLDTFLDEKELVLGLKMTFPLESEKICKNFLKEFALAEKYFRTYFHYWTNLTEILNEFKNGIYSSEFIENQKDVFWWFFETPLSDRAEKKDIAISEGLLNLISGINLKAAMITEYLTCPEQDDLIAFSAGELSYEAECQIREHLLICEECARENVFLESIVQEPVMFPETAVLIPGAVTKVLERELASIGLSEADAMPTTPSKTLKKNESKIISLDEIRKRLKEKSRDFVEWKLAVGFMKDKSSDKVDPKKPLKFPGLIESQGYRKDGDIILFEDTDKNSDELNKIIQYIKTKKIFSQLFVQSSDETWSVYKEEPVVYKEEPNKMPCCVRIKDSCHDLFILIIDAQGKERLQKSTELILNTLKCKDTSGKKVSSNTVVIIVKIEKEDKS